MELTQLFEERDAVSPVIGVILMVAITVILAAVIGAFVLGIGPGGDPAPTVSWDVSDNTTDGETADAFFQHGGGDTIDLDNVEVVGDETQSLDGAGTLASGDTIEVGENIGNADGSVGTLSDDDDVRLRWVSDGETTPLTSYEPSDQWLDSGVDGNVTVDN